MVVSKEYLKEMNKNELIEILQQYDQYIIDWSEDKDTAPACINEFIDNDLELLE